jgi:alpha-L-fucosidase
MIKYSLLEQVGQHPRDGMAVKQAFFTRKPDALYAITVGWPGKEFVLRDVKTSPSTRVSLLGVPGELKFRRDGNRMVITTPDLAPDAAPCRHAFSFKITGAELLPES